MLCFRKEEKFKWGIHRFGLSEHTVLFVYSDKGWFYMRFFSCKTHCPHIRFCERAPPQLFVPHPLKLENAVPEAGSTAVTYPNCVSGFSVCKSEVRDGVVEEKPKEGCDSLKSILRKTSSTERKEVPVKQVRWVDFAGKELVEIREFVSSETDLADMDINQSRSCECVIL
ncbi:hypothetical protein MLD38_003377 [Melastoma candidum]|uniref:Uncharacterized protein n=1 Tax=Melastoma candidum TaxID=119954 RepID=A0ACB9S3Q9_9MYRT|nr:hypothetical protein MLD38_003377 [Melastoma candidum]